jgi:hypothetical protein
MQKFNQMGMEDLINMQLCGHENYMNLIVQAEAKFNFNY